MDAYINFLPKTRQMRKIKLIDNKDVSIIAIISFVNLITVLCIDGVRQVYFGVDICQNKESG